MSSFDTLITFPINEIFEKHTIQSIRSMQNDLEKEINKKKDEIRILVGEKYRDFVDVSDKIHAMNEIIRDTGEEIRSITSSLNTLDTTYNIQDSAETNNEKTDIYTESEYTIAVLSKLLIDVENQLWLEIEKRKYMTATTLLQFAVYIRTEITNQKNENIPVVSILWDSVLRFPIIVIQFIENELQSVDLVLSTACECFCSLALLQNLCCAEVIRKFLELRLKTLESVLCKENNVQNVRFRIHSSFSTIIKTLEILYYCFRHSLDEEAGEYWKCLKIVTDSNHQTIFSCIDQDKISKFVEIHIPSNVRNFKIKSSNSTVPWDVSENCTVISDWIEGAKERIITYIPNYLNLINSFQSLNVLQTTVPMYSDDWVAILKYFHQKPDSFLWEDLYEPPIIERTKILLSQKWNVLFARVRHKIENLLHDIQDVSKREMECDLHRFMWKPLRRTSSKKSSHYIESAGLQDTDMQVKVKGSTPNVRKLCVFIESLISEMINELVNICPSKDTESQKSAILKNHQQNHCVDFVERLIHFIKELIDVAEVSEEVILFLSRVLSGILFFCPSLKQCVLLFDDKGEKWSLVSIKLSEESLNIWRKWSSRTLSSIRRECEEFVSNVASVIFRLKYLTKWNAVKVIEESDNVNSANVELHVPFEASFFVQNILNEFASVVGRTLPPKVIILEMIDHILMEIFDSIEKAGKLSLNYIVYLQFLFDVKFLSTLLIPVENDKLNERSNQITNNLESKIDPVDLDLISLNLSSNLRQFIYSTQGFFGTLINDKPRMTIDQYMDNSEDPNTVYVGPNDIPSFTLFPLSSIHMNPNNIM